jgi:hypothetical protein
MQVQVLINPVNESRSNDINYARTSLEIDSILQQNACIHTSSNSISDSYLREHYHFFQVLCIKFDDVVLVKV